ncbi:MAG: hypothetical protein Fur002_17320 [Anaerolineales bacterium]
MKAKFSVLLALLALAASTLACAALNTEPVLENLRLAKDKDGAQTGTVFTSNDTVFVVGDLNNGVAGNVVTTKWYVDKVEGYNSDVMDTSDLNITEDGSFSVNFYMDPPNGGWPVGSYKVEVFFNGVLANTLNFTVE